MSNAIEKCAELESRIVGAVELVKTTQQELAVATARISKLERELQELRRERNLVKNRIETLLDNLADVTEEPRAKNEVATHRR